MVGPPNTPLHVDLKLGILFPPFLSLSDLSLFPQILAKMTIVHMGKAPLILKIIRINANFSCFPCILSVFFRFRADVTQAHKDTFVRELKKLKDLPCVKDNRLIVGGPSITDPIERSKGFEYALLSFHENRAALDEYQASKEHHW